jgi:predicted Zn-ribbon and HTH transcriptional regulator
MPNPTPCTVNDIFRRCGDDFASRHNLSDHTRTVIAHIRRCRTEEMGSRVQTCDHCHYTQMFYNSCRDRNCPQCQSLAKERWILEKKAEVFPFQYFHVVFTLPDALIPLVVRNRRIVYNLLFEKVKETLLSAAGEEKYFGAKIGFFAVLHTWGQKLNLHPHLHCVVPGGGYGDDGQWRQTPDGYLLPVRVLAKRFRSLFLSALKAKYTNGELIVEGSRFERQEEFQSLIDSLFKTEWVVYLKESFRNHETVIEYLGRYTHKIAIANHRIVKVEGGEVWFSYKDYRDGNKRKVMALSADEFMRRFCMHIVPKRFVRIRYFGLLSHRLKRAALRDCREFYALPAAAQCEEYSWQDVLLRVTGIDPAVCPACKQGRLVETFQPRANGWRAPPGPEATACASL